ncbi:hypothetical protein BC834DRAFT_907987 [Gloeopeniophorella convolvens]|nr:hypothetical protein BC834DRAFT_907987 [Gloeopeniophorella convolvens]
MHHGPLYAPNSVQPAHSESTIRRALSPFSLSHGSFAARVRARPSPFQPSRLTLVIAAQPTHHRPSHSGLLPLRTLPNRVVRCL